MFSYSQILPFLGCVVLFCSLLSLTLADVPRPLGVSLIKATLYKPKADGKWTCLDGSKTIKYLQINDDYCDCIDGSDEPGTAACSHGRFHCVNKGHRSMEIPSSRVNDGICDCCDGSDEYGATGAKCNHNCDILGREEQERRRSEAEMHKKGAAKRSEMIAKGKQMKAERETRRQELEARRQEQESLKAEKEELKKNAETLEKEAIEHFNAQHQAETPPSKDAAAPDDTLKSEATAKFLEYDTNKDGFVEITELQIDMNLDKDRNGVVDIEEAKYFLDERERIDLDAFIALSWPRIKPMLMISEGLFKPPTATDEQEDMAELLNEYNENQNQHENVQEGQEHHNEEHEDDMEHGEEEEEEEAYEDEEADVGVGTVETSNTPAPEYDPETQRYVEKANEARNAFFEVDRNVREISNEIKELEEQSSKDYGALEEYAALDGECYKFEDREYVYTLCPFGRTSQQPKSGGAETTLGRWDQWLPEADNKYAKQKYAHGAACWNGPQRSAIVNLKCALETRITSVSEPNRCEYYFEFETPAACDEAGFIAAEERLRDEL